MRLLTVPEAKERARCSAHTIYRWIACGTLPATKPGGKTWYIREDDLEWLLARPANGLEQYVQAIVAGAPELTADQVSQLREALGRRTA